jgi:hypothetical protein
MKIYKKNFSVPNFRAKALRLELLAELQAKGLRSKFSLYFLGTCIPTNESWFIWLALPTLAKIVQGLYNGQCFNALMKYS